MNSRETGCLGVAAALALSALAGDAVAEEAAGSRAPTSPAARPRSAQLTQSKARSRALEAKAAGPLPLARSSAPATLGPALPQLMPPLLALAPAVSAPAGVVAAGADRVDTDLREKHLREAPEVPAPGAPPVQTASDETTASTSDDQQALEVAQRLLGDGVPLDLLESVIVPAARGVTIAEIQTEGTAALTLSVRPTKITRGSGLVAVGKF